MKRSVATAVPVVGLAKWILSVSATGNVFSVGNAGRYVLLVPFVVNHQGRGIRKESKNDYEK